MKLTPGSCNRQSTLLVNSRSQLCEEQQIADGTVRPRVSGKQSFEQRACGPEHSHAVRCDRAIRLLLFWGTRTTCDTTVQAVSVDCRKSKL